VIYGHRGDPLNAPENTLPALESALRLGATGVEVDLCLTRDGEVVLWHDQDPDAAIALARQLGLEGGVRFRPSVPALGSGLRQEVFRLTLPELRRSHAYAPAVAGASIPTLAEAAPLLARFERVVLDVKVPARPGLLRTFGQAARRALAAHGLLARVVVMSPDPAVLRGLKPHLEGCAFTHDVEITRVLDGGDHSAVRAALALGNRAASIGRPVVPKLGGQFSYYLEVLTRDRARIDREGLPVELIAWTIDDELELREVLAVGVDGVITNQVARAAEVMKRLGLASR
jgi:glycerophosphoryl diester phosphodiesterase